MHVICIIRQPGQVQFDDLLWRKGSECKELHVNTITDTHQSSKASQSLMFVAVW